MQIVASKREDEPTSLPAMPPVSTPPPPSPSAPPSTGTSSTDDVDAYIQLLGRLNANDGRYYLGKANLSTIAEYRIGGREGNILVVKGNSPIYTEFVMRGVFEIERRDFYMTADANYDPENNYGIKFETVKATCQLAPVKRDARFTCSITDYANVIKNLRALEDLVQKSKGETERLSVVTGGTNVAAENNCTIKLSHALFSPKPNKSAQDNTSEEGSGSEDTDETTYDLAMWPVSDRCVMQRDGLARTHVVNPIPAYGKSGRRIAPEDYEKRLSGAVVEVHFGLVHHYIRGKKRSVFTTVLREMKILRPPVNTIASPMKKRRRGRTDPTVSPLKKKHSD